MSPRSRPPSEVAGFHDHPDDRPQPQVVSAPAVEPAPEPQVRQASFDDIVYGGYQSDALVQVPTVAPRELSGLHEVEELLDAEDPPEGRRWVSWILLVLCILAFVLGAGLIWMGMTGVSVENIIGAVLVPTPRTPVP